MHASGASLSSNPAHASINMPEALPFTYVGRRNCRVSTTVRRARSYNRIVAPLPRSYASRLCTSQLPSRLRRRNVTLRSTYQLSDSTSVFSTSTCPSMLRTLPCKNVQSQENSCIVARMLARQRKEYLLKVLQTQGQIVARDVSRELQLSEDTIRRDLRELAAAG